MRFVFNFAFFLCCSKGLLSNPHSLTLFAWNEKRLKKHQNCSFFILFHSFSFFFMFSRSFGPLAPFPPVPATMSSCSPSLVCSLCAFTAHILHSKPQPRTPTPPALPPTPKHCVGHMLGKKRQNSQRREIFAVQQGLLL